MKYLSKFISWLIDFLLGRSAQKKIEEAEKEAKDEVDKIDDGPAMSDFLND